MARVVRRPAAAAPAVRRVRVAQPAAQQEAPRAGRVRPQAKSLTEAAKDMTAFTQRMINLTNQSKDLEKQISEYSTLRANVLKQIEALYTETNGKKVGLQEYAGVLYGYEETKTKSKTEYPIEAVLGLLREMYDDEAEGLKKLLEISSTPAKELKLLFGESKLQSIAKTESGKVTGEVFVSKPVKIK